MTARQCFEGLLTELSKVNAPSMLLQDFNYFFNKAVNQYINKTYSKYDTSQQTTDDLRVLKATTILKPEKITEGTLKNFTSEVEDLKNLGAGDSKLFGATYEVNLPLDYLHTLNCVCIYKVNKRYKCFDKGNNVQFAAKRLTADSWSVVINDFYNRPLPERPYYYIHNINRYTDLPTNPISQTNTLDRTVEGTDPAIIQYVKRYKDQNGEEHITPDTELYKPANNLTNFQGAHPSWEILEIVSSKSTEIFPRKISLRTLNNKTVENSLVEKEAGVRYGNSTNVRMEIRYGKDSSVFELIGVMVDYIKAPQTIRLTQEQVDLTEDTSQMMEFPDYVCQEIINELVHLVMENTADPRLQTHIPVTQSIANPAQQQTP